MQVGRTAQWSRTQKMQAEGRVSKGAHLVTGTQALEKSIHIRQYGNNGIGFAGIYHIRDPLNR